MKNLLTGCLFTVIALSLSEGVSGIIGAAIENARTTINLDTAKKQLEISKLAEAQEKIGISPCRAVGFAIPTDEEDDEDEFDDEP